MMAQFYGAPPMAMLTVAGGTLLVGGSVLGHAVAENIAWGLWFIGTITGLVSALVIPYRLFTRFRVRPDSAFGGWLMPVVPPMVSAAIGAMLVPYTPEGALRETMFYLCFSMFGLSPDSCDDNYSHDMEPPGSSWHVGYFPGPDTLDCPGGHSDSQ